MELIDKIRTEIERRIRSIESCPFIEAEVGAYDKRDGKLMAYRDLLAFLDALEAEEKDAFCKKNCKGYQDTGRCFCDGGCEAKKKAEEKEVDFEKEINEYISVNFHGSQTQGFFANRTLEEPNWEDIAICAKYYYELGLNSRK